MDRRDFMKGSLVCVLGAFWQLSRAAASRGAPLSGEPKRILFFTKNNGYYHEIVRRKKPDEYSFAERVLVELGRKANVEVLCTKDGRVFDQDLDQFDGFAFYCNEDLTEPGTENEPPMSPAGKRRLLEAIAAGKGFIGFHSTSACWRTPGPAYENSPRVDPFIAMLGGEFIAHGPQQEALLRVISEVFPRARQLSPDGEIRLFDEWYALKNFARDLHVILVQETEGMEGECYNRPPFPSTWARHHERGRVFYTSLAHTEAVWTHRFFQTLIMGAFDWTLRRVDIELPPNLLEVTPEADVLRR
ncbi:MAG: ThuA domain-containing protein [Thermoguttaceae bacterium]|nr:ThuA domain-containing protein [Thermoguttaceae bacterium]MDW8078118.1 ThuA domain-containing protein [Thermoguttaceae bacterium]